MSSRNQKPPKTHNPSSSGDDVRSGALVPAPSAAVVAAPADSAPPVVVPTPQFTLTNRPGGRTMKRILLIDLSERELQERAKLKTRRDRLEAIKRTEDSSGGLSAEQEAELEQIKAALDSDLSVDTFYRTVAATLRHTHWATLVRNRDYVLEHG